jgi:septal ring factor EnvC (AmiA/AmiB activator)
MLYRQRAALLRYFSGADTLPTVVLRRPFQIVALLLIPALPIVLQGQSTDRVRTEALAQRATDRIQALQREADRLAAEERTLLGDLRKLEVDRQIKAEELNQLVADAAQISDELAKNRQRMQALELQEATSRPELQARLVDIYKMGQGRYLRLLLSTSDIRQVGQASRVLSALAKMDADRVVTRQRTLAELRRTRTALEQRDRHLKTLRADAEHAQAALERAAASRGALIRDIDTRRDLNAQLVGELQAAQQKLQVAMRDLSANPTATEPTALPLRPFRGDLDWPVAGTLARRPSRAAGASAANGIAISAAEGSPVAAIHDGVVAYADTFGGFGNLVILDHGSQSFSLYGDLLEMSVKKGARIERGQVIGTLGPAPAGPPELYFELRIDGQSVDPLQWLKKR